MKIYKPQKDPEKGRVDYSDRTVNRILAHLKTLQYVWATDQTLAEALDDR